MSGYIYLSDIMDNLPGLKDMGEIDGSNIIFETPENNSETTITFKGFRFTNETARSNQRINVIIDEDLGAGKFGGIKFKDWFDQCFMAYTPEMKKKYLPVLLKTFAFVFNRRRSRKGLNEYRGNTHSDFYDFIPYSYKEGKYHIGYVPSRLNFASLYFMGYLNCQEITDGRFMVGTRELNQIPGLGGIRGGKKSNLMIYERWPFYVKKLLDDDRFDNEMLFNEAMRLVKYFMCVSEGLDTGNIPHDIFCTGLGSDFDTLGIDGPITRDTPIPDSAKYYPITDVSYSWTIDNESVGRKRIGRYLGNAVGMCFWIIERTRSFEYLLDHIYNLSMNEGGNPTTLPIKYLAAYLMPPNGYDAQHRKIREKIIFERWDQFISILPRLDRRKLSTSTLMQISNVLYETIKEEAANKIVSLIYQLLLSYDGQDDIDTIMDLCMSGVLDIAGSPEAQYLRNKYYRKWDRRDIEMNFRDELHGRQFYNLLYFYDGDEFILIGAYKYDSRLFEDNQYIMRVNGNLFETWDEVEGYTGMDKEELVDNLYITGSIGPDSGMKERLFMSSNESETLEYIGQVNDAEMAIGTDETWPDDPYDWSEFELQEDDTDEG